MKNTAHTTAKKAPPAAPENTEDPEYDPNEARPVLAELLARHGHVTDEDRTTFDTLSDNDSRIAKGKRTRGAGVLSNGVAWAVKIDLAWAKYPAVVEAHYSRERYSYYLDRLAVLNDELDGLGTRREGTGTKRQTAEEREKDARAARTRLIEKMEGVAGNRAEERKALDGATGTAQNLGDSLLKLVTLGRSWLASADPVQARLCKSARLTDKLLSDALAAGKALTGATKESTLAGPKAGTDSPEVNLAEGWVLEEMEEAQRCFQIAHRESSLVPRLAPGKATRQVLGTRKSAPEPPADTGTGTAPPGEPAPATGTNGK
jgi:hypothetical protein